MKTQYYTNIERKTAIPLYDNSPIQHYHRLYPVTMHSVIRALCITPISYSYKYCSNIICASQWNIESTCTKPPPMEAMNVVVQ